MNYLEASLEAVSKEELKQAEVRALPWVGGGGDIWTSLALVLSFPPPPPSGWLCLFAGVGHYPERDGTGYVSDAFLPLCSIHSIGAVTGCDRHSF